MSAGTLSTVNATLATPMTRRSAIRTFATAGVAMATIGSFGRAAADDTAERHTSQLYTVTTHSNFRSGPGTSHSVISVIPPGATFTLNAQEQNGFYAVNYKGTNGWVYAQLIVPAGSTSPDPVIVGEAKTSTAVNLRSGPGTGHQVLRVVSGGSWINVSNTVQNGFRYVVHQGLAGWMADQYIVPATNGGQGAETFTTTANLNLRAEPSTSAKVLLVMPSGSKVTAEVGGSNGFRKVTYKGTTGWAATAYLN